MHAVTFHAVDTQMKSMYKQGVGERSEPHSLYVYIIIYMHINHIIIMQHDLYFFARTKGSSYSIPYVEKNTLVMKKVHEQVAKISLV